MNIARRGSLYLSQICGKRATRYRYKDILNIKVAKGVVWGGIWRVGVGRCAIHSVVTEDSRRERERGEVQRSDQSTVNRAGVASQPANHD